MLPCKLQCVIKLFRRRFRNNIGRRVKVKKEHVIRFLLDPQLKKSDLINDYLRELTIDGSASTILSYIIKWFNTVEPFENVPLSLIREWRAYQESYIDFETIVPGQAQENESLPDTMN